MTTTATESGMAIVSIFIACLALAFTIGSFWWLHARRGSLVSFEPQTFAAAATPQQSRVRLPLVLFNTGATPIVVQDMRLRFPEGQSPILPWALTRSQLKPASDDGHAFPAVFSILGRSTVQMFIEFGGPSAGGVPAADCQAQVDVKLGHRDGWDHLLTFTLRASRITDPNHYITYSNRPDGV
jgi:hypothetical protein